MVCESAIYLVRVDPHSLKPHALMRCMGSLHAPGSLLFRVCRSKTSKVYTRNYLGTCTRCSAFHTVVVVRPDMYFECISIAIV